MPSKTIAANIAEQIISKLPGEAFVNKIPDFDIAYAMQDEVALILAREFGGVAGYKIAWNSPDQIAQFAPNAPAVGHVFKEQVFETGVRFPSGSFGQLVVEPEIIAVIGEDIKAPDQTAESVLPLIAKFHAGFEIMDRRNSADALQTHPPSIVANNIFNNGVIISEQGVEEVDFSTIETVVHQDGAEIMRAMNSAPQKPALAVATVANNLLKRGKNLRAGDKVLCGTHMPPFGVDKGALSVSMGSLGEAHFNYG